MGPITEMENAAVPRSCMHDGRGSDLHPRTPSNRWHSTPNNTVMVMAQGNSYKMVSNPLLPSVFLSQPTSLPALLGSYTSPAKPNARSHEKIMHNFANLLLFALSPLTILAQPPHRAQTALAEENPVVQVLDKAASEYIEAYELADKLPASCVFFVRECTDKLVRTLPNMIVPSLLVPPLTWRANANQKVIPSTSPAPTSNSTSRRREFRPQGALYEHRRRFPQSKSPSSRSGETGGFADRLC